MIEWMTRHRAAGYLLLNAIFLMVITPAAVAKHTPTGQIAYLVGLVVTCSAPLLLLDRINGRYALLAIFMALYFGFFGALDLFTLLFGPPLLPGTNSAMSSGEVGILIGGVIVLASYIAGVRLAHARQSDRTPMDWPPRAILIVGIVLWTVGTVAIIYFQVFVAPEKSNLSLKRGLDAMGPLVTFTVLLATLMQPLGLLCLAYGYARFRALFWRALIIAVMLVQVVVAFITDVKGVAIVAGMLVIVVQTLVHNRLPKVWLGVAALFLIFAFPVFQAYRAEIAGARGMNREQALQNLGKVFQIAMAARNKTMDSERGGDAPNFLERLSSKENVLLIFQRAGVDTPYLGGKTLMAVPLALVPRIILPNKEDVSTGQLFAKVFLHSDSDVFISLSYLGELYWNFGWSGVLVGMTIYGLLLGVVGARSDLSQSISVTRLLLLVATAQGLCMGFGSSIGTSSTTWIRAMAAIGILHLLFARKQRAERASPFQNTGGLFPRGATARFPNVLQ